jgi:hypothetical protein
LLSNARELLLPQTTAKAGAVKNNGGTLRYGGAANTANGSPITNIPALSEFGYNTGKNGAIVPGPSTTAGTDKPLSGGTFAYKMQSGVYMVRRIATTVNGSANTSIYSGASDYGRNSIHRSEKDRRTKLGGISWVIATGDNHPTFSYTRTDALTTFSQDEAARPTRAIPGEFVFRDGSPTPSQKDYPARTNN